MGKNFFNKLGNILKVFKGPKKKTTDDSSDVTSESCTGSTGNSNVQLPLDLGQKLIPIKSKSFENLTKTVDCKDAKVNQLKRTTGTLDILNNTEDADLKCTKSLNRFPKLTHTNQCVLSYNVKLHDSTIWSKALGTASERLRSKKNETTRYSTSPFSSERATSWSKAIRDSPKSVRKRTDNYEAQNDHLEMIPKPNKLVTSTPEDMIDLQSKEKPHANKTIMRLEENSFEVAEEPLQPPKPQKIAEQKRLTLQMDLKTIKNEHGFDLLKYDVKSSGDSNALSTTQVIIDHNPSDSVEKYSENLNPSKVFSDSTTEYEVVNLTQVDLFEEFKTTISKMRNVLNVLEDKKPLQEVPGEILSKERKIEDRQGISTLENMSTQTGDKVSNKISASTECRLNNKTKNEGVMVQFSSDTTSKHITLKSNLFKHIKPMNKTKRLKKKGYKCRTKKFSRKTITSISSSDVKTKKKKDNPGHQKCVVYHITHHKNARDRCVGTLGPTAKEELILKDTFSALHFGPIKEFPVLLDKHENEKVKGLEQKQRSPTVDLVDYDHKCHRGITTSFLSIDTTSSDRNSWLLFKNRPSVDCFNSKDHSSTSDSAARANWFVFNSPPPVLMTNRQSTSEDIILNKNRDSTRKLVSRIIHKEFKTSGIKGKISSDTMNLIKDQFCDKLNGVKTKDISNVMITVSVPLKSIVSKMKSSKKAAVEDKSSQSTTSSVGSSSRLQSSSNNDKGVQVNDSNTFANDNLQTIPEKMVKKSTEIYQHNKMLRETMSSKRLATFKKVLGNKATSCSSITPFGHLTPRRSRIYYSDHSTSSPDFGVKQSVAPTIYAHKKNLTTPRSSSLSLFKEDIGTSSNRRGGFYLNLPRHRCRKMREQISRLFDSDSSDRRFFTEPKLLYHVHESSFYSTSKTDDKFSSKRMIPSSSDSKEKIRDSYFPVQEASSKLNLKVKSKLISFSDLPKKYDSSTAPMRSETNEVKVLKDVIPKPMFKDANVNTSKNRFLRDNETQFERVLSCSVLGQQRAGRKSSRKGVDTNTFFGNCIDEFSMVSFPKVHFEDDIDVNIDNRGSDYMKSNQCDEEVMVGERLPKKLSNIALYHEDAGDYCENQYEDIEKFPRNYSGILIKDGREKRMNKMKRNINLQTTSNSNLTLTNQKDFGIQLVNIESIVGYDEKDKSRKTKNMVKVEAVTQVDTSDTLPKSQSCLVQVDATKPQKDSKLSGLVKEVVDLCNSSFAKSRDCIVELTLYNLIKEIIMEHCSHLSDQSRQKVESILSNFIQISKHKAGSENVDVVESAIENLVKEIGSSELSKKHDDDSSLEKFDAGISREPESKHKKKRSDSQRKEHKQESNQRNRHKESEVESREKRRHKEEEKKYKQKRHHSNQYDDEEFTVVKQGSGSRFKTVDGKIEYLELVRRLKELEDVTKQLSTVAKNKNSRRLPTEDFDRSGKNNAVYNASILKTSNSKRKMALKTSKCKDVAGNFCRDPVELNFFHTETENPVVPRDNPKLPVTKIVINLSNLKLLTEKCGCLSSPTEDPIIITDSTQQKQKLIDRIVSYQVDNDFQRHSSDNSYDGSRYIENTWSDVDNQKKESLKITINERNGRNRPSKRGKDVMKIKLVKKKKTFTSNSETTAGSNSSRKSKKFERSNGIQRITKAYMKKEYNFNSTNIDEDFLANKVLN